MKTITFNRVRNGTMRYHQRHVAGQSELKGAIKFEHLATQKALRSNQKAVLSVYNGIGNLLS